MAIDLNKSHYNKDGNKIIRTVTPEKEAEEIYPQNNFAVQCETNIAENANNYPQETISQKKNNTGKIIMISGIVVFLAVSVAIVTTGLTYLNKDSESESPIKTSSSLSLNNYHYIDFDVTETESIVIDADNVHISVSLDDSDYSGKITASDYSEDDYFSFSIVDGVLNISGNESRNILNNDERNIYISLPCEFSKNVTISCDNGDVYVSNLNGKNLDINTESTEVSVYDSTLDELNINSSGGYISLGNTLCSTVSVLASESYLNADFLAAHNIRIVETEDVTLSDCYSDEKAHISSNTIYLFNDAFYEESYFSASEEIYASGNVFEGYSDFNITEKDGEINVLNSSVQNADFDLQAINNSAIYASLYDNKSHYTYSGTGIGVGGSGEYKLNVNSYGGTVGFTFGECEEPNISEVTKFAARLT